MPSALRNLYFKSTAFAGIAKIFLAVSGVITIWQLNLIMSKDDFGAFMIVFSLYQIIAATLSTLFQSCILYHVPSDESTAKTDVPHPIARAGMGLSCIISAAIGILCFVGAPFLADLFNKPDLSLWFAAMAGFIPAFTINMVLTSWHRALQNIDKLTLYNEILPSILRIAALASLGFITHSSHLFTWIGYAFIASYLIPFAALYIQTPLRPSLNWRVFSAWDFKYAAQSGFGQLVNKSTRNLVIVLSGALASTALTADFAIASRFGQLLLIPKNALVQLLTPRIRAHLKQNNRAALIDEYRTNQALMLCATLCGIIAFILFSKPVLAQFGDYGQQTYDILILLSIASLLRAAFGDAGGFIAMAGHAGWALITHTVSFVTLLIGFIYLVPEYQGIGAAYATNIAVLITILSITLIIKKKNTYALIAWPEILTLILTTCTIIAFTHTNTSALIAASACAAICCAYIFIRIKSVLHFFSLIKNKVT